MSNLSVGDLVWAKMKTFSPWPSMIVQPKDPKRGWQWVFFFGSNNYGWVEDSMIKPYLLHKEEFVTGRSSVKFKNAVEKLENYIKEKEKNPEYTLKLPTVKPDVSAGDSDKEFDKLISQKTSTKRPSASKRHSSDAGPSTSRSNLSSPSKRTRTSSPKSSENGIANVGTELLNIPSVTEVMDSPIIDLASLTEGLKHKNISASNLSFGFIGAGNIGQGIIKNLINSGHRVNLFSRTLKKCDAIKEQADELQKGLVNVYKTPYDVMHNSDIVFSCVSDPRAAKLNLVDNCGIAEREGDRLDGKGYVEMTSIDPNTSKDICEIIEKRGGRYLEAQIQGSKKQASLGQLIVLAAGDKTLFLDCQSCFKAMGNRCVYVGEVGYATKINLILQLVKGISLVGLAEALALADRCRISPVDIMNIYKMTLKNSSYLEEKSDFMINKDFKRVEQAVEYMQKDMKMALDLSDQLKQPLLITSTANEMYKHVRRLGYDGHDVSCVYMRTRH